MAQPTVCTSCASPLSWDDLICPSCGSAVADREPELEDPRLAALRMLEPSAIAEIQPAVAEAEVEPPELRAAREAASRAAAAGAEAARRAAARASADWQSPVAAPAIAGAGPAITTAEAAVATAEAAVPTAEAAVPTAEPAIAEDAAPTPAPPPALTPSRPPEPWPVAPWSPQPSPEPSSGPWSEASQSSAEPWAKPSREPSAEPSPEPWLEPSFTHSPAPVPRGHGTEPQFEQRHVLTPSSTNRTLGTIGGRPGLSALAPRPVPIAATAQPPIAASPYGAAAAIGNSAPGPFGARRPLPTAATPAPTPTAAAQLEMSAWARISAGLKSLFAQPKSQLVATCLVALGGASGVVSFFLPWASSNGWGIGVFGNDPRPNAWAFDQPAGWALFLFTAILVTAALAGDKLGELLPGLAPTIRRLTEVAAPMILGGIYLGVTVVYWTVPWSTGSGLGLFALAGCLLVAGSIVGLFFPAGDSKP
jgi:hypothetical protein